MNQNFALPRRKTGLLRTAVAAAVVCACGGKAPSPPVPPDVACTNLNGAAIPASAIGLPTAGASVTATSLVAAGGTAPMTIGEYCKVSVAIHPVDATAPDIKVQVNLPSTWNGKALMFGGGGYDGVFSNNGAGGAGNYFNGPTGKPVPLGQGYATFASDSGHTASALLGSQDGSFGTNAEALKNFAGDALKKTRDAAIYLLRQRYGSSPSRSYFVGGSTGGREALAVIQRWPQDFDGAISMYPAWNPASLDLQFGRITRALAATNAYSNDAKKVMFMNAVLAACDALDGTADGVISNVAACVFDPNTVRCPGGTDTGNTCLSDAQIGALQVMNTDLQILYPNGSGSTGYPGFNVFAGADLTGALNLGTAQPTSALMTGGASAAYKQMPYGSVFWDQWVKYFVTNNPSFDSLTLDPQNPGTYQQRIGDLLGIQDVAGTNFSAFQGRGGKLLLMHGLADGLVSTRATIDLYGRIVNAMGSSTVASFLRFYTIPGLGHVLGSPAGGGFQASWDPLAALEAWVENGTAPTGLVTTDMAAATKGRTRPLCEYPAWPKYSGSGDPNLAASFTCATQ